MLGKIPKEKLKGLDVDLMRAFAVYLGCGNQFYQCARKTVASDAESWTVRCVDTERQ